MLKTALTSQTYPIAQQSQTKAPSATAQRHSGFRYIETLKPQSLEHYWTTFKEVFNFLHKGKMLQDTRTSQINTQFVADKGERLC